jgi:hypothetical protein
MSERLLILADEISPAHKKSPAVTAAPAVAGADRMDADVLQQVKAANDALQKLNRRYAALLQHSSRSIALMSSLFSGYQGQFQGQFPQQNKEASGAGSHHHTWSCQM